MDGEIVTVTPPLDYCVHGYCETEHCRTCEIMGVCKLCLSRGGCSVNAERQTLLGFQPSGRAVVGPSKSPLPSSSATSPSGRIVSFDGSTLRSKNG